ncbi:MAG: glucose sorbosone dehydrogenase [Planctomycetota bacterium]|nr:MAG: glucose sorbosone dehydrogenase [Planctomycetota bacterium]
MLATCLSLCCVALLSSVVSCKPEPRDAQKIRLPFVLKDAFPKQKKFDRPLLLEHTAADPGHVYVVSQVGRIWRIPADAKGHERQLFYDGSKSILHPRSGGHNEEGLLGFAFDPGYAKNRHVWMYYSERRGRRGRQSVVARYDVIWPKDADSAAGTSAAGTSAAGTSPAGPKVDVSTELRVLELRQPWGNHNGGTIVFGPDRMMYIAVGDGGAGGDPKKNGQNLGTLLASVLRIDVRKSTKDAPYAIPKDNPFVKRKGARGEIWCFGLRNPWRISFDRKTGELWCADVGQNRWEEVNRLVKGKNYGWRALEGTHRYDAKTLAELKGQELVAPVAEYSHREGMSVTGGYVYRGKRFPELVGRYLYGDFVTGRLWSVREDRKGAEHEVQRLLVGANGLSSFAELPSGELLLLRFDGRIYRMARRVDRD